LFCNSTADLIAAHIIDESCHADVTLLNSLGITETFETANGMILCNSCHDAFDAKLVCVDADSGKLIVADALAQAEGFCDKWAPLIGSLVRTPQNAKFVHLWPSHELFVYHQMRYNAYANERRKAALEKPLVCPLCKRFRVVEAHHLSRHMNSRMCVELQTAPPTVKAHLGALVTPSK
jgi:hypothetical protein